MMKKTNRGQTALILILLAAAALIFLAITLNWGRIAQVKALVTIAADQSAAMMASDVASYGEMEKQTNLNDTNQIKGQTGIWLALLLVVLSIIVAFIAPAGFATFLALVSVVMATTNLVLQVVVIQPGITSLWNSLQKNQPIPQQFYEGGVAAALQGSVGDQVNITDYLDWNANGSFGLNAYHFPNDTVSRFAVFYTDRLKMLNQPPIPQVVFFYDQLDELMNGETCDQNLNDHNSYPAIIPLNPACANLGCTGSSTGPPACQVKIPNGFQLNDACTGSDPGNTATYSPYCDPCCQPLTVNGKAVRPSSCLSGDSNCGINNPYGSSYPDIYDSSFQNYAAGLSFLDQFGRDQQMAPFTTSLTPQGSSSNGIYFPNGIYPFFWLMNEYSPEADNLQYNSLSNSQLHWCTSNVAPGYSAPPGYLDLAQLSLPYSCSGQDCCVNYLVSSTNGAIDMVGSPSFPYSSPLYNPALDPSFGEGGSGSWVQGDDQMCLTTWPYNGSSAAGAVDGTCELAPPPTVDSPDDTMHTLSDFVNFANTLLSKDVGTLSSSFSTWYPQVFDWVDPTTGRLPPLVANLNAWNTVITNWLNTVYTNNSAWCVPPQNDPSMNVNVNGTSTPTAENNYIASGGTWGSLPSVIACLNYNATTSVNNYQSCLTLLQTNCPASLSGTACDPVTLGRSLAGAAPTFDGNCDPTVPGSYAEWVQSSKDAATNQAPKFALRSLFLTDVYAKAKTMQTIFSQGAVALQNFLNGAAAQLMSASQTQPSSSLPNSVIYGWVDNTYPNGHPGYAHIVKVTAYSVGRNMNQSTGGTYVADSVLPWIKTECSKKWWFFCIERSYTLTDRDGSVYVSVKRWDEDHSNSVFFPNGRPLWQFMFHNPNGGSAGTGTGISGCLGGAYPGALSHQIGIGLDLTTVQGLEYNNQLSSTDQTALANAFMLNFNPSDNGTHDPNSGTEGLCLTWANQMLANAPESHICAQYIASRNASGSSGNGDSDYSIKFVNCGPQPEDLQ